MKSTLALVLPFAALAAAWLPHQANIRASHGHSLFKPNGTSSHSTSNNGTAGKWLPGTLPVRGVNLGSLFVVEPWMASNAWTNVLQCPNDDDKRSEFDCVKALGQDTANQRFAQHWGSWITASDFDEMISYGLNTVRIPVGYWMFEALKYDSESFPAGGQAALKTICGLAADRGMYVIIDLHGAPFAQVGHNADTGQLAGDPSDSNPAFFQASQYDRALQFLGNMTNLIHANSDANTGPMRTVGMLEVVNEPWSGAPGDLLQSMRQSYYPDAVAAIRNAEAAGNVGGGQALHVQMMNTKWGCGDPTQYLPSDGALAFDDHRYLKWDGSVDPSQQGYISASCNDNRGGNGPTIVGEWSLSVNSDHENSDPQFYPVANNIDFYQKWFAAQVRAYETGPDVHGWVFWSWKAELNDPRWSYRDAVSAGIIPKDLSGVAASAPC